MDERTAWWTLLGLVPKASRAYARRLLRILSVARQAAPSGPVYVSEYNGYPSRVHLSAMAAQGVCADYLRSEPGGEPTWDWFPDEDGWLMRCVDTETDRPGPLLGGRVTRTEVEG